jgi:hypothetical protein
LGVEDRGEEEKEDGNGQRVHVIVCL